jgi:peptide chain release factor 1
LLEIEKRFEDIENQLMDPETASNPKELERLGKARAELSELVEVIRNYKKTKSDLKGAQEMLDDPEVREMAQEEIAPLRAQVAEYEEQLKLMLLPKDPNDEKSVIIEIRPAAGGDEAGIFAGDLFRMYSRYAERRRWGYEVLEEQEAGVGGYSKLVFKLDAAGAYSQLKHESGVHRVQRVPSTESQGRIHTSTVTVAVLPEAEEVDIEINDKDLEISSFRSSASGGQHMQKNDTAIRIVHKPSGIVVQCQDERSQNQNKVKALTVLRTKLYDAELEKTAKEQGDMRRGQIGSGDRSEKIRTYNYPQDRVTDHRIGKSIHGMPQIMDGDIQELIDALNQEEQAKKLAAEEERLGTTV